MKRRNIILWQLAAISSIFLLVTAELYLQRQLLRSLAGLRSELLAAQDASSRQNNREAARRQQELVSIINKSAEQNRRLLEAFPDQTEEDTFIRSGVQESRGRDVNLDPAADLELYRAETSLAPKFEAADYLSCFNNAERVLGVQPRNLNARFYRAASLLRINPVASETLQEARQDLLLVLGGDPEYAEARYLLAEIALEEQAFESVLSELSRYCNEQTAGRRELILAGGALLGLGRYQEAAQRFAGALELNESDQVSTGQLRELLALAVESSE